ncbi:MAG TPA: ATP-binding cassette domain-containing protein [Tepidisphaeraceae bacterium]|jgi:osmoprotectant transport system ATP-binding protein|nr:ATP-binding cassette domain-containing protein [Tepidisphaeraceae bacterium]
MFRIDSVSKSYADEPALDGVSLTIAPGETTVLIGPSGSGKSTLFGLLTGLLKPDAGIVYFCERDISRGSLRELRQRIGYVIQDGGLFPHLTGRANVSLMATCLRWPKSNIESRIDELLELTRLSAQVLDRYPAEMSGGQRQRVALVRALMLEADVLLLDEPLGALDPIVRAELQQELAKIFRRLRKTVVLITHDLGEAAFFADRIVLLRHGRVVQTGSIDDLLGSPADDFVRQFVHAQQMTGVRS